MKKSIFVLAAILCAGLAPNPSHAQTAQAPPTEQTAESQPTSYAAMMSAGRREFKAGNYENSAKFAIGVVAMLKSPAEKIEVLTLLGESYYRRKMYAEAQTRWENMLEIESEDEDQSSQFLAHLGLARVYSAQNQWDKAAPEYQLALDQLESHLATEDEDMTTAVKTLTAPLDFALGNAYSHIKQYDLAEKQLKQIIRYSEGDSGYRFIALLKIGQNNIEQRDFKGALEPLKEVLALASTSPEPLPDKLLKPIESLIPLLQSFTNSELGVGQANDEKPPMTITLPPEFGEASDVFSQTILNELFDGIISDSDEDSATNEDPKE